MYPANSGSALGRACPFDCRALFRLFYVADVTPVMVVVRVVVTWNPAVIALADRRIDVGTL